MKMLRRECILAICRLIAIGCGLLGCPGCSDDRQNKANVGSDLDTDTDKDTVVDLVTGADGDSDTDTDTDVDPDAGSECWNQEWKQVFPLPTDLPRTSIASIWGSSATDLFAVGWDGFIMHSNGKTWTEMGSGTTKDLNGVWGAGPNDVYAVGEQGTIAHYDGVIWRVTTVGRLAFNDVWGTSSDDVYAVSDGSTIAHFDGLKWQVTEIEGNFRLVDIAGSVESNIYIAANYYDEDSDNMKGAMLHCAGTSCSVLKHADFPYLTSVWVTPPSLVLAVGYRGGAGQIWSLVGQEWSRLPLEGLPRLFSIWGSGSEDIYITGNLGELDPQGIGNHGGIYHFDGSSWSEMVLVKNHGFNAVSGTGPGEAFAAGYSSVFSLKDDEWTSMLPEWNKHSASGGSWTSPDGELFSVGDFGTALRGRNESFELLPTPAWPYLTAVWGTSRDNIYAGGGKGTLLRYDGVAWEDLEIGAKYLLGMWVASTNEVYFTNWIEEVVSFSESSLWNPMTQQPGDSHASRRFTALWGVNETDLHVAGEHGNFWHFDGFGWSRTAVSPDVVDRYPELIWKIVGNASNDVYALGFSGAVYHYDGASWSELFSGAGQNGDIFARGINDVYTVGSELSANESIGHFDGVEFRKTVVEDGIQLHALWGAEAGNIFVVGQSSEKIGLIYRYGDQSLTEMDVEPIPPLRAIFGFGSNDVFASGDEGIILHYDGEEWTKQPTDTIETLGLLSGNANGDLFAASVNGTVLTYDSGTWRIVEEGRHCNGILDIWGSGEDNVFATCSGGGILHYDGSAWQTMNHITTKHIRGISGCGPNDLYAAGTDHTYESVVLHYDGASWRHLDNIPDGRVRDLYCAGPGDLFGLSESRVLRFDGLSWTSTESGLDTLHDIHGFGPNKVFVVGTTYSTDRMTTIYYDGAVWKTMDSEFRLVGAKLSGTSPNDLYVVGEDPDFMTTYILHNNCADFGR